MNKKLKLYITLIFFLVIYPFNSRANNINQDFTNWNRLGILIEKDKIPFSLQVDAQLRLIKNISTYDAFQIRNFINYDFNKNNTLSLGYLFSNRLKEFTNVIALQYTNKLSLIENLVTYEGRVRLEKRWTTDTTYITNDDLRLRIRAGLGYILNKEFELIINDEVFMTDILKFTENRMQTGIVYKLNDSITLNLFYQNHYVSNPIKNDKMDHTIFTNLLYKLRL